MLDVSREVDTDSASHPRRGGGSQEGRGGDVVMADAGGIAAPPTTLDAVWDIARARHGAR